MKKILVLSNIAIIAGFILVVTPTFAAKPTTNTCATIQGGTLTDTKGNPITTGYDKWGYNYQADMFNGWYDNYSRPSTIATGGDSLMMKWNDAWLSNQDCDGDNKLDRHYGFPSYIDSGAWLTNHASGTYESSTNYHWNLNTSPNKLDIPWAGTIYSYDVTFSQNGTILTGTLTDGYYPITNSLSGTIDGNNVTFSFTYPDGSIQGVRTYVGTIDSTGKVSGTWSETGPENATGNWSVTGFATKIPEMCSWSDFVKIVAVPSDAKKVDGTWYSADGTKIGPDIWGEFAIIQEVSEDPCGEASELGLMNLKSDIRSGLGHW
jgi:hypothetical protein